MEVVLALGVATFGLIAIFGLFAVGVNTSKQAGDSTALSSVAIQVADQLRGGTNSTVGVSTNFYFTKEGVPTNSAAAYYQCRLSSATNSVPIANLASNFVTAKLAVSWPAAAPAASQKGVNIFATAPFRP